MADAGINDYRGEIYLLPYLRLCRIDAALIAFFSYLGGATLAGSTELYDVAVAVAVTLISTNFIYSFNSWTDWSIDKINKPYRPIPSGRIKPKKACIYSLVLLGLSVIYPFFVYRSQTTLFLFLLLPFLGLVYSARPVRLKRFPFPAIVTICLGLITPIMLGYFMNTTDNALIPFFIVLFLYCLSVVPLKTIEEVEEDKIEGVHNLYSKLGNGILIYAICGLLLVLLSIYFFKIPYVLKSCLLVFAISSIGCIVIFAKIRARLRMLYQTIIYLVVVEGIAFYLILRGY